MATLSTYDFTFDETFTGLMASSGTVALPPCQSRGVYLGWLSPRGWSYWLFTGKSDTEAAITTAGQYRQAGLTNDTLKEDAGIITVRAGGLTRPQMDKIRTILRSVAIYLETVGPAGNLQYVKVNIDTGTYSIWRESLNRATIEFKIMLPALRSQRA